jgi:ParB-like chromosome segregation protein Spo0J
MEEAEKIVKIPLGKILIPDGRVRKFAMDEDFEELKQSIADVGLIHPVEVTPAETEGLFELVEGERRVNACRELGWSEIPAVVRTRNKLQREQVEIEENLRRKDYSSTERHLALARLAKIKAAISKPGRPVALTPEQVERAKRLRQQGKSFSEIAEEFGVNRETVRQYLEKYETAVQASSAESGEKIRNKRFQLGTVSSAEQQPVKGIKAAAKVKGVGVATVTRALKTEDAVSKYPFLREIPQSTLIQRLVSEGEACRLSVDQMKEAAELVKEGFSPEVAANVVKVQNADFRRKFLEWHERKTYPAEWIAKAAQIIWANPQRQFDPDEALYWASALAAKEYRVRLPHLDVIRALEAAAEAEGISPEAYIGIAVLEKLVAKALLDAGVAESVEGKLRGVRR